MCAFAKVDVLSFWKKYRPKALLVNKISVVELREVVGQSPPFVQLQIDHSAQVTELHLTTH
jgi:hypothetical protein